MLKILRQLYIKKYKVLITVPVFVLLLSLAVLGAEKFQTGEYVDKDISLRGGTLVTAQTEESLDIASIEEQLETALEASVRVKEIKSAVSGSRIGYTIEFDQTGSEGLVDTLRSVTGLPFISGEYTIEEMSSALSSTFWSSTLRAIALAFVFMASVVFLYFRKLLPSVAIILAAVSNLIGALALMNIFGIKLSTAGVAAMLMLLGYSVDTNILLSTRMLKRKDLSKEQRLYSALKTGLTMASTTITALLIVFILSPSSVLRQITLILIFGLLLDMLNTWVQNAGLLRWYMEEK